MSTLMGLLIALNTYWLMSVSPVHDILTWVSLICAVVALLMADIARYNS